MAKESQTIKLAVILHADVVGSTRMVTIDEQLAHERIQDTFRRFGDTISNYSGHVLESRGDAILAKFERPSDAVSASLAFQQLQSAYLVTLSGPLKPLVRIGIAMGEVVIADNTITGAGVVLAQRVEQLANPGSLCITAAIHEALSKRFPFELNDLGEKSLKGFDHLVRVFKVSLNPGSTIPIPEQSGLENILQKPIIVISDWEIDPAACSLTRKGETVRLEPKAMDLLVFLAKNPGKVHSRDFLLEKVWSDVIVSDESLTNAIIKLRKALQDSARNPEYIETLPKRGYRLIADVEFLSPDDLEAKTTEPKSIRSEETYAVSLQNSSIIIRRLPLWTGLVMVLIGALVLLGIYLNVTEEGSQKPAEQASVGLDLPDKPSIAVLPFMNIGNDIEDSYFSDGITDDLITDLSRLSGLFVISRTSSFPYKGRGIDVREISKTLGVRYLLEGRVRRNRDRVRVNVQLIDGLNGEQLWADRYDGEMKDVFSLQDRMTGKIISALSLKLSPSDKAQLAKMDTISSQAYDEFLKGWKLRWSVNRETYARAEQHFKKALEYDPEYVRAHAGLALLYMKIWQEGWHENSGILFSSWSRARKHLDAAMVNPDSLTHSLRSTLELHNRRYEKAISEARQAVALNPSSVEGHLALAKAFSYSGEILTAIYHAERAQRLDPNFPAPYLVVKGRALFDRESYPAALKTLEKALRVNPDNTNSLIYQVAAYGQLGETKFAKTVLDQLNSRLESDQLPPCTLSTLRNRLPYKYRGTLLHLRDGLLKAGVPEW